MIAAVTDSIGFPGSWPAAYPAGISKRHENTALVADASVPPAIPARFTSAVMVNINLKGEGDGQPEAMVQLRPMFESSESYYDSVPQTGSREVNSSDHGHDRGAAVEYAQQAAARGISGYRESGARRLMDVG